MLPLACILKGPGFSSALKHHSIGASQVPCAHVLAVVTCLLFGHPADSLTMCCPLVLPFSSEKTGHTIVIVLLCFLGACLLCCAYRICTHDFAGYLLIAVSAKGSSMLGLCAVSSCIALAGLLCCLFASGCSPLPLLARWMGFPTFAALGAFR